jgi:hypothetical protein
MYLTTHGGFGELGRDPRCEGWERDRESFSKVVAEHYVRTEFGREMRGNPYWCGSDGKLCDVKFPDSTIVRVSFVGLPEYVIARQIYVNPPGPRREYDYECPPDGKVILRRR